jgi:hypothetical protein
MKKNIIIAALLFVVIMCWIKVDPECIKPDDPNSVIIEYECNNLVDYDNVPPEVIQECRDRALETINRNKTKI